MVPVGFAARVARRALAGDTGEHPGSAELRSEQAAPTADDRVFSFVVQVTAIAATLLIALSIGIGALRLPEGDDLRADAGSSLQEAIHELDQLNRAETDAAAEPDSAVREAKDD